MPTDGVLVGVVGPVPFFSERGERSSGFIRSRSLLCTCIVALIFYRRNELRFIKPITEDLREAVL